jgi:hypothetical protein
MIWKQLFFFNFPHGGVSLVGVDDAACVGHRLAQK